MGVNLHWICFNYTDNLHIPYANGSRCKRDYHLGVVQIVRDFDWNNPNKLRTVHFVTKWYSGKKFSFTNMVFWSSATSNSFASRLMMAISFRSATNLKNSVEIAPENTTFFAEKNQFYLREGTLLSARLIPNIVDQLCPLQINLKLS